MKRTVSIFIFLMSLSAFGATKSQVIFDCRLAQLASDYGVNVQLLQNSQGFLIQLTERMMSHSQVEKYSVQIQPKGPVGDPTVYAGEGVRFSIQTTTTSDILGRRKALLVVGESRFDLMCARGR